jgi:Uncharacterized protein conserved in bacteria
MKLGFIASVAALLAAVAMIENVEAQPYPSRPIKLVVPYGPGGAGDVIARIVSEQLGKELGVSVVVENKPGAGGMIGAQAERARAPTATPSFWAIRRRWSWGRTC